MEGVETTQDLKRAIQIGARYVQGYLFSPAEPEFQLKNSFTALIEAELDEHRRHLQETKQLWQELGSRLVDKILASGIRDHLGLSTDSELGDQAISHLLPYLDATCLRVFLCRNNGIQLTANHYRDSENIWRMELEYRNADWSWRPYFIPHLSHEDTPTIEAKVSAKYADLDTHDWIRTISIPIGKELVLLIDVADNND